MKYLTARQDAAHELSVMQLQIEQSKVTAGQQLQAIGLQSDADLLRAQSEAASTIISASLKPSGFTWIDAVNAAIRPITIAMLLMIFGVCVTVFTGNILIM